MCICVSVYQMKRSVKLISRITSQISSEIVLLTMTVRALDVLDLSFHNASMKTRMRALAATTLAATIAKIRIDGSGVPAATPAKPQQTGSAKSSSLTTKTCTMTTMMTALSTPKDRPSMTV